MRGLLGGALANNMGYAMFGRNDIYELMIAHAQGRCTDPLLCDDPELQELQIQEAA